MGAYEGKTIQLEPTIEFEVIRIKDRRSWEEDHGHGSYFDVDLRIYETGRAVRKMSLWLNVVSEAAILEAVFARLRAEEAAQERQQELNSLIGRRIRIK